MNKLTHQICLIGSGPVGLTLANCLAKSPYIKSVAIVDRKIPKISERISDVPNQRVYSINGLSLQILNNLKVSQRIRKHGIMQKIQVVSKQSESFVHWSQNEAIMVQNDEIINCFMLNLKQLQKQPLSSKIEFIEAQIKQYSVNEEFCNIKLSNDKEITTQLLVGSDGNKSKVKELAKIPTYGWNYNQKAIVCTLKINQSLKQLNKSGYQIYYEGNVLAILPLWDNYVSIVWSLQLPEFQYIMGKEEPSFLKTLNVLISNSNNSMAGKQGYVQIPILQEIVNKRLSFPLSSLQAGNYISQRIALIGDAAHSIHPMAGLGVNSGIVDSVLLANNIISNKKTGNDIGQAMALSNFQSKSKAFNYANSVAMEAIKKTFQATNPVSSIARKLGMNLFEQSDFIKSQMKLVVNNNPLVDIQPYQWQQA